MDGSLPAARVAEEFGVVVSLDPKTHGGGLERCRRSRQLQH